MEFKKVKNLLSENFEKVFVQSGDPIFEADIDKDELWNLYLDSFPAGTNEFYRQRREMDCSYCRQFIRNVGGAVTIDENLNVHTVFGFDADSDTFQPVMDALDAYVKSKAIVDPYFYDCKIVGVSQNRELLVDGTVLTWDHFQVKLPETCVKKRIDISTMKNDRRTRKQVFKRSLDEISMEALDVVLELIASNTLYKGEEWKYALQMFKQAKIKYDTIPDDKKDIYAWKESAAASDVFARIRNHSIGVLLVDISEGIDLDTAVSRYEKIVAPTNYKRPEAIFTKRMLEDAKKTITDLGYLDSLPRRYATLDDITVNNILFSNRDAAKRISGDIFDDMLSEVKVDPKQFSKVEEIPAEKFVSDILPTAKEVEVYLENRHAQNMVSLIAPVNKYAPSMFKWNNGFGWAYTGNITDSDIRENVKSAGGNVDGVLRFSIQWNDGAEYSFNDLDAHCFEPGTNGKTHLEVLHKRDHIFFANKKSARTGGFLDVDIRWPIQGKPAVENIAWTSKQYMIPGDYIFKVHQYANRGGKDGFRAEIEFDGQIYRYDYAKELRQHEVVDVATVTLHEDGTFTIKEHLTSQTTSRDIWGLKSNTFIPVSVVMYSPNYWDYQKGIGHRHYFFMLKDCVNPENPNGFYNEFLKSDLEKHKRVFEALGGKMAVAAADDQLSGIGFSTTKRKDLIVRVTGATKRVIKVKF